LYATLVLFTFPLKAHTRYYYIHGLAHSLIWLLRIICNVRMEVRGAENIPQEPCIILCKHQSAWETFALQTVFPPQVWVLKRELLWLPFFGWGLALTSPIAINRSNGKDAMRQLLKQGKERLRDGFCVVVFPEGTRMPFGRRGKYKIGGAMLAASSGAPVVPVAHNAGKHWGRNSFLKYPGTIVMSIGKPVVTAGLKADEINRQVEDWIEAEVERLG
jgi:1-acyl-sn-glycerol-3-phosphate acyltransferase